MDSPVVGVVRFYPKPFIANSKWINVVGVRKVPNMVNLNIVDFQPLLKKVHPN